MSDQERQFYETKRRALIMELGAIEDLLGVERSIVPRTKRQGITAGLTDGAEKAIKRALNNGRGASPLPTR